MAPVFSEAERGWIRERLLETGYELFSTRGLKKTSLEDLTGPAGIAKSSFYSYFDSKEALFLELMVRQWPAVEERLYAGLREADDAREAISRFLRAMVEELEVNPLGRRFLTHPEEMEMIMRRVGPAEREVGQRNMAPIVGFLQRGQAEGRIVEGDPEVMAGVMAAVGMLPFHEREIGEEIYPRVLRMMIALVAEGLTTEQGVRDEVTPKRAEKGRR